MELKKKEGGISVVEAIGRLFSPEGPRKDMITGQLVAIDKNTMGLPLQTLFRNLDDKIRPTLQWPIDFGETNSFQDAEKSAVKDMLNLQKDGNVHFLNIDDIDDAPIVFRATAHNTKNPKVKKVQ